MTKLVVIAPASGIERARNVLGGEQLYSGFY